MHVNSYCDAYACDIANTLMVLCNDQNDISNYYEHELYMNGESVS